LRITIIFLIFFLLPACRKWRSKKIVPKKDQSEQYSGYQLHIDGIECKECIKTILRNLRDSKLISFAECACHKNDFAQACTTCFVEKKQHNFPAQKIKAIVESENFVLNSITGTFFGTITQKENESLIFTPQETEEKLTIVFDAASFTHEIPKLAPSSSSVPLYGTLNFDAKQLIIHTQK